MYKMVDKTQIGEYVSQLVNYKFESQASFCKAWLEKENLEITQEELGKKANKFSQIKNGKKAIQIEDLPIFCSLLGVNCEEILSAGKIVHRTNQLTSYLVAHSNDQNMWEEYIHIENHPILNKDEYEKTVLDYAVSYHNLELIEYLIDHKYIWFDSKNEKDIHYSINFGAGTKIKRIIDGDGLEQQISNMVFREKIIALAIEKNNLNILKELKAREIPDFYSGSAFAHPGDLLISLKYEHEKDEHDKFLKITLNNISKTTADVIDYYTTPFIITDSITKYRDKRIRKYEYMCYYISKILDVLVENKHSCVKSALKRAIQYSQETYKLVKKQIEINLEINRASLPFVDSDNECTRKYIKERIANMTKALFEQSDFRCNKDQMMVRVVAYNYSDPGYQHIVRNLIYVSKTSKDQYINSLISELNELYDKIINIENEFLIKE